jgi:hypothetical protein
MLIYSLLLLFIARETLSRAYHPKKELTREGLGGYESIVRDRPYIVFTVLIGVGLITPP